MPTPHSSVNYIEPNFSAVKGEFSGGTFLNWALKDDYERAPRLEDYSIMLNLEVEVCSRKNISKNETVTKDVLILSYTTNQSNGTSVVNFMGGTKIECNDAENHNINFLTTNYADMYVGDLINYGTTELIGVKSVDIEYQKSCVPIINIKFTDVRGLSLFQPTELSRTNSYQGIGGINADNVAQSFFQCFFKVPMPKFTITIKGFYGKPVTYEVLCDKFETSFNSDTGDFDINTRFIGYSYSFLTDIVMDALLAAPYSDYGGKEGDFNKYWVQEINSGRFTIQNKEKTARDNMPTLYEIFRNVKIALKNAKGEATIVTDEEKTHAGEIDKLNNLKDLYTLWYSTLYNICCEKYGKEYVYPFKDKGCYYRLLILTNNKTAGQEELLNLAYVYENTFTDEFKEIHQNLNSAIDEYNQEKHNFRKIENVSKDFSGFKRANLFNRLFVNDKNEIVFNGFHKGNNLPQTDVFSKVFRGVEYSGDTADADAEQHKKHVLGVIYNDGVDQYIDCYSIDVDYRYIDDRIKALQADANRNPKEKEDERRIKALNKEMFKLLGWHPSVENFTRIMMAHLETLMKQLYDCVSACEGRTASQLGVSPGENLDVPNATEDPEIPPFPRVYRPVVGDDGITKNEDTWVGEFTGGIGFQEVDFINGLFNGAEKVVALYKDAKRAEEESKKAVSVEASEKAIIKHPLTSFDFYINKPPYGASSDVSADETGYALAGRIAMRMFDILAINYFRKEQGSSFFGTRNPELVGRVEAENFYDTTKITNDKIITMIRNGVFSEDNIISYVTSGGTDMPWGNTPLFTKGPNLWLDGYRVRKTSYGNAIYPIQDISYGKLKEAHDLLNQGDKVTNSEGNISLWNIPTGVTDSTVNTTDNYGYGTTLILDNPKAIREQLQGANTSADSGYTEIYEWISSACSFDNASSYGNFATVPGIHSISTKVVTTQEQPQKAIIKDDDMAYVVISGNSYVYGNKELNNGFSMQSENANFTSCVITEVFGMSISNEKTYYVNRHTSLANQGINPLAGRSVGKYTLSEPEAKLTLCLMGILLNTDEIGKYIANNHTVTYLPKLAVLQIGAIIFASGGIHADLSADGLRKKAALYLPVENMKENSLDSYSKELFVYISKLSKVAKHQYEKYYIDWISANKNYAAKLFDKNSSCYLPTYEKDEKTISARKVLNQNNETVQSLTNELLRAVCIVRLSVNHHTNESRGSYVLSEGTAKSYLKGFIDRLKELYHINVVEDKNGNIVKTTDEPHKTTPDMKKELYRYMKQLYDKWIPMSSFKDWQLESFFITNGEEMGHKFYFIDSYYNDISNKLLINPKIIAEKVEALLSYEDINSMLLGFMADMYSANKAMFMSIQNFADLKKPNSMNEMFTPISYNSIKWSAINKYPSFVVVYPYQASKNLNIPNGEYTNDGFMLNDEFETPMAIRTKGNEEDGHYRIPAFGVSYGKQYQSYFKKVNINMQSPVATEQSIRAKHAILIGATSSGEKGIKSQDLYDVYASQSYTCDVEMMGCAWVQPLMYFVLLNVPMFRGSYMIMKVKHSIKPGVMTTNFTGCRMANVSNTLVEDIFTDGDIDTTNTGYAEFENERQLLADTDNDCPYKIYPLWESNALGGTWEGDEKGPRFSSNKAWAIAMFHGWLSKGVNTEIAKVIVAQEAQECGWGQTQCAAYNFGGFKPGGKCKKFESVSDFIDYGIKNVYEKNFPGALQTTNWRDYFNIIQNIGGRNPKGLSYCSDDPKYPHIKCSGDKYTVSIMGKDGNGGTYKTVCSYLNGVSTTPTKSPSAETTDKKDDIKTAFFNAVNKSAQDTPSISTKLKREDKPNDYIRIIQDNGKTDKLPNVFDMIINSEYYNYIQDIGWVYPNGGLQTDVAPTSIYCKVSQSPNMNSKGIWATQVGQSTGMKTSPEIPTGEGQNNGMLLRPLAKRRAAVGNDGNFKKEVPQLKDLSGLDKYKPQDCNTLVSTRNGSGTDGGSSGSLEGYNGNVKPNTRLYTLLDVANNGKALDYMDSDTLGKNYKLMDARVSGSKAYRGCCTSGPTTWYKRIGIKLTWWNSKSTATSEHVTTRKWFKGNGFNMVWHGHLSDAEKLPTSSFCPGDVATFHVYDSRGRATSHGVMWTGKDWRSDCIQRALSCYPGGKDRDGNYSVCIWRMPSLVSEGLGINNTPDLT